MTKRLRTVGAIATVVAVVVNVGIYATGRSAGVEFLVSRAKGTEVGLGNVAGLTGFALAFGFLVAVMAQQLGGRRLRMLQVLGGVIALVTLSATHSSDATTSAKWLLALMHLVAGTAYVAGLEVVRREQPAAAT